MNESGNHKGTARILLIEDNPSDVELVRTALTTAAVECELTVLEDGEEAMEHLRKPVDGDGVPDLVVLDLNLPKHDGVEVLQAMRATPAFAEVPVAIMSSSSSMREKNRIEPYRVSRYITKPPDLDEFLRIGFTIRELLGKKASGGGGH